jgi:sensor domain CHASE-containing protein
MPTESTPKPEGWKFSRTVVIDTLIGIAIAIIAIVWFASSIDKRLTMLERDDAARQKRTEQIEQALREQQKLIEQVAKK